MKLRIFAANVIALAAAISLTACGGNKTVERTATDSTKGGDLSGYWNDIDANLVSAEMIQDCLARPWASDYQASSGGKKPVVKLMGVIKRTDDRNVNEQYFTKRLEREMLNSGKVRVVAGDGQDSINRREQATQSATANDRTVKSAGNEVGSDFTLQTVVNSQNETDGGGHSVRAYLINMELVNVGTNEKVWIGEKAIRKVVTQQPVKF
jgi:PBP1b-binding outer membrane lipoprotein LpoB